VAPAAPLTQPMLARSGPIPTRGDWAFEVKWDGFRAIVSTEGALRVRSRRGWNMTELVPELSGIPVSGTFDGELVAFSPDGAHDFPLVCERMLMRRQSVAIKFVIFDLLSLEGRSTMQLTYSECRTELEGLGLNDVYWMTPEAFDDGDALFEAICEHELEGIVAKRRSAPYRAGERAWVKTKNRNYWRYELEREGAIKSRRQRQFV
jgi:bifunctional non-homologous end joining protein LigD